MAKPTPPRMQIVSPKLVVPTRAAMEKSFTDFAIRMRKNLVPNKPVVLSDHMTVAVRHLARRAYDRRSVDCGLHKIDNADRPAIVKLAETGASLTGPASQHEVDEWSAALHAEFPWMSEISTAVMNHMRQHVGRGEPGLSLPPLLLVGPPGCGKSWYAQWVAVLAGTPSRTIDVGSGSAAFRITGTERGWSSAQSGLPVETVLATRVANPVMVVDEVCKVQKMYSTKGSVSELTTALLQMMERASAKQFECPNYRVIFDLSRVNWILTANDLDRVPAPLQDRCEVFRIPEVTPITAALMFDTLTRDRPDIEPDIREIARDAVITAAARSSISLRQIQRILEKMAQEGPLLH